jgi:hypothetical protein
MEQSNILIPINFSNLLKNWNSAIVDLNRNNGMFLVKNVRLRNCSLHYNQTCDEYYINYKNITFGINDIYNMI